MTGLGVSILLSTGEEFEYFAQCPDRSALGLADGENLIYTLELYGALLGVIALTPLVKARGSICAILGVDNNAALVSLLKGYGRTPLPTSIICSFWYSQPAGCLLWIDRIRSKANRADGPSRGAARLASAVELPSPSLSLETLSRFRS